jgi:hypothetical protein
MRLSGADRRATMPALGEPIRVSHDRPARARKRRTVLYYWRLLRQLPWLVLRYRL